MSVSCVFWCGFVFGCLYFGVFGFKSAFTFVGVCIIVLYLDGLLRFCMWFV